MTGVELRADRRYLTSTAYADDRLLNDRRSLYEHQQPRIDLVGEVVQRLGDATAKRIADIGCGNGAYLSALVAGGAVVVAVDLSDGMLRSLTAVPSGSVVADAQELPLPPASVDAVLAMHMLYHVPDPALAVGEARRILRPGGLLLAAVGGERHLVEAKDLWGPLLREAGLDTELRDLGLVDTRLPVDRLAGMLGACFDDVHLEILASEVVLDDPGPLLRHAASTTAAKVAHAQGEDMIARLRDSIGAAIRSRGTFRVTTEVALFSATVSAA